jgi:hypothetical protein
MTVLGDHLRAFNLRLVDDARHSWKWSSVRFIALGSVLQGAVLGADRTGLSAHIPDWVMQAASTAAFLSMIAAGIGRVTTTEKPHESP